MLVITRKETVQRISLVMEDPCCESAEEYFRGYLGKFMEITGPKENDAGIALPWSGGGDANAAPFYVRFCPFCGKEWFNGPREKDE